MTFPEALKVIVDGNKITKLEWNNRKIYGVLVDGILTIHKEDNQFHPWTISYGDLTGTDFVLLVEGN